MEFEIEDIELFRKCSRCSNPAVEGLKICESCRIKIKEYNKKKYVEDKSTILAGNKKYREENPTYNKEYSKRYREENPDYNKNATKRWRENNKTKSKEIIENWNQRNPEKLKAKYKRYCENNKEKIKLKNTKYRNINKVKFSQYAAKRRAIKANAENEPIDNNKIYKRDLGLCQICKWPVDFKVKFPNPSSPSIDHIIPLSKGGSHTYTNLQLTHLKCNIVKRDKIWEKHSFPKTDFCLNKK